MTSVYQRLSSFYHELLENGDKRTDVWPLVYSPVPVTLIFLLYLCVVHFGPRLMRHCDPFDLRTALIAYNFGMVGLCAYMCYEFLVTAWLSNYSLVCQPVDYSRSPLALRMASVCWLYFVSKIIELSDTVFFILRKKNNHLSFLHVYHHSTMIFCVLQCSAQRTGPHSDVLLLRFGSSWSSYAEVSVVEEIFNHFTAGPVYNEPPTCNL